MMNKEIEHRLTDFIHLPINIMIKINLLSPIIREYTFGYLDGYNNVFIMQQPNRYI